MKHFYLPAIFFLLFLNNIKAQVYGCTDPPATNYNSSATANDGSCVYAATSVSADTSLNLSSTLSETSGLIHWNNQIWTHNDNTDINIYSLDTTNGNIFQTYPLTGTANNDWEEISQDSNYIYIGDFGNNANGNRTDLKILRVEKNSILLGAPIIDTINFSYSDQTNFTPTGSNNTNFDCEAFVVSHDSIYLFTKQWVSNETSVYSLPKIPGSYVAGLKTTFDVQGLITGAVLLSSERIVALSGYSNLLQPFIFLLYDFSGSEYFSGNRRKILITLPFHQVEGITSTNGTKYYMTNEYFSQLSITVQQKFHIFDLSSFLGNYLNSLTQGILSSEPSQGFLFYPNPANDIITVELKNLPANYYLFNALGQTVQSGKLIRGSHKIDISELPKGIYFLRVGNGNKSGLKLIKQ